MHDTIVSFLFIITLIVLILFSIALSIYSVRRNQNHVQTAPPWFVIILYTLCIILDWYYAYKILLLAEITASAWLVVYPIFSYFYLTFSVIAVSGIFHRMRWGFNLAYITILAGSIACANSYFTVFTRLALVHHVFLIILIVNAIVVSYLAIYFMQNKLGNNNGK